MIYMGMKYEILEKGKDDGEEITRDEAITYLKNNFENHEKILEELESSKKVEEILLTFTKLRISKYN